MVLINKFTCAQSIQTGDNKIVFAGGMESMSCSRHCIHARPGVKFGDVSMEDTLLKVGQILGKVRRYIYSRQVGYWGSFGDVFAQGGLYTREYLEIYFLFTQGGLELNWRYIFFEWVGYQGRFGDIFKYLLRVGWKDLEIY